jgi:hypothetical protein
VHLDSVLPAAGRFPDRRGNGDAREGLAVVLHLEILFERKCCPQLSAMSKSLLNLNIKTAWDFL